MPRKMLWGGRFAAEEDPFFAEFNDSLAFDRELLDADIEGSLAYARALERAGVFTRKERLTVEKGLRQLREENSRDPKAVGRSRAEDIHSYIEEALGKKAGNLALKLHTGRSRNDQVATDLRIYLSEKEKNIERQINALLETIAAAAQKHIRVIAPGYTHLQRAQPVLFAHHLLAYGEMLLRDRQRLREAALRINVCPLGSGALSGTVYPIDRSALAADLGFASASDNSMDAVADRDFVLDALYAAAVIMLHLSRLAEDLILFSTEEFQFISLPDELCTGSSLMPHKKNPDALELIRGKAGRTTGDLMGLFATVKGLPMTYNRDLQEDKEPLFHGVETAKDALAVAALAIRGFTVDRERMERAARESYMPAVEAAEYLAARGVPFREAHHIVGTMVRECETNGRFLWQITVDEFRVYSPAFEEDIVRLMDPNAILSARKTAGGASVEEVEKQIAAEKRYLSH